MRAKAKNVLGDFDNALENLIVNDLASIVTPEEVEEFYQWKGHPVANRLQHYNEKNTEPCESSETSES